MNKTPPNRPCLGEGHKRSRAVRMDSSTSFNSNRSFFAEHGFFHHGVKILTEIVGNTK